MKFIATVIIAVVSFSTVALGYGAIAVGEFTGNGQLQKFVSTNQATPEVARQEALALCRASPGISRCRTLMSFSDAYVAITWTDNFRHIFAEAGPTRDEAEKNVMAECKNPSGCDNLEFIKDGSPSERFPVVSFVPNLIWYSIGAFIFVLALYLLSRNKESWMLTTISKTSAKVFGGKPASQQRSEAKKISRTISKASAKAFSEKPASQRQRSEAKKISRSPFDRGY